MRLFLVIVANYCILDGVYQNIYHRKDSEKVLPEIEIVNSINYFFLEKTLAKTGFI